VHNSDRNVHTKICINLHLALELFTFFIDFLHFPLSPIWFHLSAAYADASHIWGNFRPAGIAQMAATAVTPRVINCEQMT
jgi:hypothetical protein